jgi:trans-aconitate 2-methyltransferase
MIETGWNPQQYHQFSNERTQPALDLMNRIPDIPFTNIVDLGCGTGEHTASLAKHWPDSAVTGVDSSSEMLGKARLNHKDVANLNWIEADLNSFTPEGQPDLIYSNAALHWLDNHEALFPSLASRLESNGVLAIQMPRNFDAPSHQAMNDVALDGPWKPQLKSIAERPSPVHEASWYYDCLSPYMRNIQIWETSYSHILEGDDPVARWTYSTGLKPYLEALQNKAEQDAFYDAYAKRLRMEYPKRTDGKTLFQFKRLFIVSEI